MNDNVPSSNGQAASHDALTFLRWLYGDTAPGFLTISTFDSQPTQWFFAHQLEPVATYCQAISHRYNVYLGLGLRGKKVDGRGESEDVCGIPGFWIEIDIKHAVHVRVNLPETIEDAIALVVEALPLKPTLIIHSGYGIHVYWLFREPWLFDDAQERQTARHLLHRLQATIQAVAKLHGWDVDSTFDLARVLRIPGTYNRKVPGDQKLVGVIEAHDGRRYNPSDFPQYLIAVDEPTAEEAAGQTFDGELSPIDLTVLKLPAWLKYLIHIGKDPDYDGAHPSRSEATFKAIRELIKAGCDDATITSLMLDPRYGISEKPREKGRKWLASDLARAHAKINGHRPITASAPEPEASEPTDERYHSAQWCDDKDLILLPLRPSPAYRGPRLGVRHG